MIGRNGLLFFLALGATAGFAGCGGPGGLPPTTQPTSTPTSVIFIAPPPSSLAVNASATIYAATQFSAGSGSSSENTQVTYSVSCGTPNACGTLTASDEVGATVYTAPSAIPSDATVTFTATSVADTSLSRSVTISIVPPIPISVQFLSQLPASLQVNASFSLSARIENDFTANPEVMWTATCGGVNCGSFSSATTGNETTTTYTAPSANPPGNTVTVTATSITDSTKSVSGIIVITAAAPTLANGTYVFQLSGPGPNQATFITGVLVAQNGIVIGGEQDAIYDNGDGPYSYFQQFSTGSYATTPDGNLAIIIQLGPDNTETLNGTLASSQKGFIAGIDGTFGNGTLDLQTSTAAPSGGYAFALDAGNLYDGSPWIDGIFNIDSAGGISGNGSILDVNAEGAYYGGTQTLGSSTVSSPDAYGRVLFQLNPGANSTLPVLYVAGYVVDQARIRLTDVGNANNSYVVIGAMGGAALGQGASTGDFGAASVAGTSYVFGAEGEDQQGTLQIAGVLTFNVGGSVTGTLNWNDLSGRSPQNPLPFTGTYTVEPTGRVTLTNLTDGATFKYSLHLYLTGDDSGLVLSDDTEDVFAGQAFQQQPAAFTVASFDGSYGLNASLYTTGTNDVPELENAVGPMTATSNSGADDVTGFADTGAGMADFAVSGSFSPAANGAFVGTLTGFDSAAATSANTFTLYLVDSTQGVAIETDNAQLTLARLALVQ